MSGYICLSFKVQLSLFGHIRLSVSLFFKKNLNVDVSAVEFSEPNMYTLSNFVYSTKKFGSLAKSNLIKIKNTL